MTLSLCFVTASIAICIRLEICAEAFTASTIPRVMATNMLTKSTMKAFLLRVHEKSSFTPVRNTKLKEFLSPYLAWLVSPKNQSIETAYSARLADCKVQVAVIGW